MRTLKRFFRRLGSWANKRQAEDRLQAEIEDHLARQTAEYVAAGLSPAEARRQAVLKFGAVQAMQESYRDVRGFPLAESLVQDARFAQRRLRSAPAFTLTAVLMLALGIGATTSIFTLVYEVLLKPLAVAKPSELLRLGREAHCCNLTGYSQVKEFSTVSYDMYRYFQSHTPGFAELAAFSASGLPFGIRRGGGSDAAQSYEGEFVSGNYFTMFGIRAYAGRMLTVLDDRPNAPPVAVISYRLWTERYGANASVIGSVFDIDRKPFTVVGVTPPGFFGDTLRSNPPDFFMPLNTEPMMEANANLKRPDTHWLDLIGRIRPGANPAAMQAQMRVELKQWLRSHWGQMSANDRAVFPEQTLFLEPGGAGITNMREGYEHWLQILMMVTGFVLLIVCANVASLMLVRGMERRRQISVSMALGAQAARLMRQAFIESILLSLLGGAAGVAVAFLGTQLILHFAFPPTPGVAGIPIDASPSGPVLLFALGISLVTGIVFGIAPAWTATRVDPIEALRGANRSSVRTNSIPRKALAVLQAALSLVLLSASGLLAAALYHLQHENLGFNPDRRVIVSTNPRLAGYRPDNVTVLYRRIHDALMGLPGVSAVALCSYAPISGTGWGADIRVEGHPPPGPKDDNFSYLERVTPGYFTTIGTPVIRGRGITEQDAAGARHVAVISEAFARKFFKHENPLGQHCGRWVGGAGQYEIVGIVPDAIYLAWDLDGRTTPSIFLPEAQHDFKPNEASEVSPGTHFLNNIVVVTRPGVRLSSAQISAAIASVDPNLPIVSVQSLKDRIALQFTQQRLIAQLSSFFGVLSLVLASIGLYGVTAYNAGQRTNEIGVRMALGASRADIVSLVLRGAFLLIGLGLRIGFPLTLAVGRFLGSQLYGLSPYDPVVIGSAVVVLGLSAIAASLVPAFRASSISPMEALRVE